jgi:hypothetical protein
MERFRLWFSKLFAEFLRIDRQPSSESLLPASTLSRFLRHSNQFNSTKGEVKSSAFLPPPDLQLSTFHIDRLEDPEIWDLAKKEMPGVKIHGRGDFLIREIPEGLKAILDNDPPRHVNICGWPSEKEHRKELALVLASKARLRVNL